MKKLLFICFIFALLQIGVFADDEFLLGTVESRMGKVNIVYLQSKTTAIRIAIVNSKIEAIINLSQDLNNFKSYVEKFNKWHKIAVDNNSVLNKKIGDLSDFQIEFITFNNKYEIAFSNYTGMRLMTFDQDNINKLMEIISDENIDKIINAEKRKKQKEDELFQ